MMVDHRRAARQRTFKGGRISLPIGTVDCLIRNMSPTGALLELKEVGLVPDDFSLIIKPENTRRQCRVVRREGLRLGVKFVVN